jgi:hypothetical protein
MSLGSVPGIAKEWSHGLVLVPSQKEMVNVQVARTQTSGFNT